MNRRQLQTILWLRWRLTRNRFGRAGPLNAVVAIFVLATLLVGGVSTGIGGFLAGWLALGKAPGEVLLLVWDGVLFAFLVFWLSGILVEIQRSESIDLGKLLHLPVSLEQVFVFNYLASHLTPSIVLCLPAMVGLGVGLTLGAGLQMILLVPLVLSFVFLVSAWTYCLRGWLAALMVNKRRRRAIMVWVTIVFVLIFQAPNLVFNSRLFQHKVHNQQSDPSSKAGGGRAQRSALALPPLFIETHLAVPPGWVGYGARALKDQNPWPTLAATALGCLLGAFGLARAYRMTLRFYRSANGETASLPKRASQAGPGAKGRLLVERELPWLPDDTAALLLATLRSLLRSPELKMALIMPLVAGAALCAVPFARANRTPQEWWLAFGATGAALLGTFSFAPTMSNIFGLDRDGFRALVLLPIRRHHIFLAKNFAFFPYVATVGVGFLVLVKIFVRLGWAQFLAGLIQVPLVFLLFNLACNLLSVLVPYRLTPGTLQAKKPKPVVFLGVFLTMLALPVLAVPILIPPGLEMLFSFLGWAPWLPVNLLGSAVLLVIAGAVYWLVLPLEGRLLQSREQKILQEVTEEAE